MPCEVKIDYWRQVDTKTETWYGGSPQTTVVNRSWFMDQSRNCSYDPLWREKVANKQNATGSYNITARGAKSEQGKLHCRQTNAYPTVVDYSGVGWWHDTCVHCLSHVSGTSDPYFQAQSRFIDRVNSAQRGALSGCFAVEGSEILRMIRNPAKALYDGAKVYLNQVNSRAHCPGRFRKCKAYREDYLDNLSSLWLETWFGWVPIMSDIEGLVEQYASKALGSRQVNVSAFANSEAAYTGTSNGSLDGIMDFQRSIVRKTSHKCKIKGKVSLQNGTSAENLALSFGLDGASFLPTLWEVIPWSFLVDYFANVDEIVSAVSFSSANLIWASTANIKKTIEKSYINALLPRKGWICQGHTGQMEKHVTQFSRTTFSARVPDLELSIPGSPMKWLNMAALAVITSKISQKHANMFN